MKKSFLSLAMISIIALSSFAPSKNVEQVKETPQNIIQPILICWEDLDVPSRTCVNFNIEIPFPGSDIIIKPIVINI